MKVLKAFCLAFTTYSRIPMLSVYPSRENMRYLLCFLPLVGAAVGALLMLWFHICVILGIDRACFAAVAAVLPVLVTGGIHVDGYIDTNDALSSFGGREKILEILSDPHIGAFGVITAIVYFVLCFGFMSEITAYGGACLISAGFVLSRALCALEIALMKAAKKSGMLYELKSAADKAAVIIASACFIIVCAAVMVCVNIYAGAFILLFQTLMIFYYKHFIINRIGGVTGDTCGYYILLSELLTVIAVVTGFKLLPFLPYLPSVISWRII